MLILSDWCRFYDKIMTCNKSKIYLYVAWFIRHCSLGLICFGLGLIENFWPRPHTFWPRPWPHPSLASLTSMATSNINTSNVQKCYSDSYRVQLGVKRCTLSGPRRSMPWRCTVLNLPVELPWFPASTIQSCSAQSHRTTHIHRQKKETLTVDTNARQCCIAVI